MRRPVTRASSLSWVIEVPAVMVVVPDGFRIAPRRTTPLLESTLIWPAVSPMNSTLIGRSASIVCVKTSMSRRSHFTSL